MFSRFQYSVNFFVGGKMKWQTQYDGDDPWGSFQRLQREAERKIRKARKVGIEKGHRDYYSKYR